MYRHNLACVPHTVSSSRLKLNPHFVVLVGGGKQRGAFAMSKLYRSNIISILSSAAET